LKFAKALVGLAALISLSFAVSAPARADNSDTARNAATYCVKKGGVVQTRIPEYGTNGDNPLVLSGSADFCQFTSEKDGSQINVLLSTLMTKQPSLAALAYYAEVPLGSCTGNPGSCYCSQVGGTDLFGGINAAGGGWVLNSDSTDVLEACIFPDLSSIDSWGLAYHSAGIVRGTNLAHVLKYKSPYEPRTGKSEKKTLPF
jgi:putative hemolysin